jgi:hypothetical protein
MDFGFGDYLEGLALLLFTFGACIAAGTLLARRWVGHLRGSPRWLALATAWTATIVAAHLVPGALGILTRGTVPLCAALILAAAVAIARRPHAEDEADAALAPDVPDDRLSLALGVAGAFAFAACALALEQKLAGRVLLGQDTTNFQVPTVARWLLNDSVWGLHQFVPDYSNATYPQNGNLVILSFVLPFHRPFLAGLQAAPYLALVVVAAYALARELRVPRGTALLAAVAAGTAPRLVDVGLRGAMTDAMTTALLGIGMVFLLRHSRNRRTDELGVAAVALGLAAGSKWYGLSCAVALVAVWALVNFLPRRNLRSLLGQTGVLVGLAALAGGFWLVRNWVRTGNPLFPVKVAVGGLTIFDAAPDRIRARGGFTLLHYATDFDVWRAYIRPAFTKDFGWLLPAFGLGVVGSAALALRRRRDWAVVVVAGTAILLFLIYAATPYSAFGPAGRPLLISANTRYALPVLIPGAAVTAWAIARSGVLRPVLELALLGLLVDALHRGFRDLPAGGVATGAFLVFGAAAVYLMLTRQGFSRPPARSLAAAGLAALALVAGVGDALRDRYRHSSYAEVDPVYAALGAAPTGTHIAVAGRFAATGVSPILPAMGPALRNSVAVIGTFRGHYLRRFERAGPFLTALQRGDYDLLVVGRGQPPGPSAVEEVWAHGAGWVPVVASRNMVLMRHA